LIKKNDDVNSKKVLYQTRKGNPGENVQQKITKKPRKKKARKTGKKKTHSGLLNKRKKKKDFGGEAPTKGEVNGRRPTGKSSRPETRQPRNTLMEKGL